MIPKVRATVYRSHDADMLSKQEFVSVNRLLRSHISSIYRMMAPDGTNIVAVVGFDLPEKLFAGGEEVELQEVDRAKLIARHRQQIEKWKIKHTHYDKGRRLDELPG
jgi:hypothetical protein